MKEYKGCENLIFYQEYDEGLSGVHNMVCAYCEVPGRKGVKKRSCLDPGECMPTWYGFCG